MTDRFVVPEPSEEAYAKFFERTDDKWLTHISNCMRHAYAVDVPAIVRTEVEWALKAMALKGEEEQSAMNLSPRRVWWDGNHAWRKAYLAARFPGATPEMERPEVTCFKEGHTFTHPLGDECGRCHRVFSRHGETVAAVLNERLEPMSDLSARRAATDAYLRDADNREENGVKMLPAERDFLRNLAVVFASDSERLGTTEHDDMVVAWCPRIAGAARRVVEEAK